MRRALLWGLAALSGYTASALYRVLSVEALMWRILREEP